MPIYRATITGRDGTVLVKAESAAKAKDLFVEVAALTAEQMQDALDEGEAVWKSGTPLPGDVTDELAYLRDFRNSADFGPGHGDVIAQMSEEYTANTGKPVPESYAEEAEEE